MMTMTAGPTETPALASIDEVFGKAALETAWADDPLVPESEAAVEDAATVEGEQPEGTASEKPEESIFGDLLETVAPIKGPGEVDWAQQVEVKGFDKPVSLGDLRDGYLRQADYTRKTQALAEEKRTFEADSKNALSLYAALSEDPVGTAAYLAAKIGLVTEEQVAGKIKDLKGAWTPPPKPAELEVEIERRVEARLAEHPRLKEAEQATAERAVETAFTALETKHGVKLQPKDRAAILRRAIQAGTTDLDLTFSAMMADAERVRRGREDAKAGATNRPGTRVATASGKPAEIKTVKEAFEAALTKLAAS
jgi:hypothetical protein